MNKKIILLVLALLSVLVVGGAIRYFFMQNAKHAPPPVTFEQQVGYTKSLIELLGDNVTIIKTECGKYPESLTELVGDGFCSKSCPQVECLKADDLVDGWGKSIDYFHDSERLTIRSRGKDGREGGIGEDEDYLIMLPMRDE